MRHASSWSLALSLVHLVLLAGQVTAQIREAGHAIAIDSGGRAVYAGGEPSAFIAKQAGGVEIWRKTLGSAAQHAVHAIATGPSGEVYAAGALDRKGFLAKLDSAGDLLAWLSLDTPVRALVADGEGNAYLAGDGFVRKVDAHFTTVYNATINGATVNGQAMALAVNAAGEAIVGESSNVRKLSADGATWLSRITLGPGAVSALALDAQSGAVFVTGTTSAPNFPVKDPAQNRLRGASDAFVAKITPDGAVEWATYLGGSGADAAAAIALNPDGTLTVAGYTTSADFPGSAAGEPWHGPEDGFLAQLDASGAVIRSSYLGRTVGHVEALAVDRRGTAYVTGWGVEGDPGLPIASRPASATARLLRPAGPPSVALFASAGSPQSVPAGSAFPYPLEVTLLDSNGNPLSGYQVTFSAPASGPSATFPALGVATTDTTGRARITPTANATAGSYNITATLGGGTATFTVSNINPNPAAGPCVVTSTGDDNSAGTLRYQAAACGKGGTVTFSLPAGQFTVTLAQGQDIQLTQDISINGGPATNLVKISAGLSIATGTLLDANHLSRVFFIAGGNISLTNLTLRNGMAQGGTGGAGYIASGGGAAGMGGAVFMNAGIVSITNSLFLSNQALGGNGGPFGNAGKFNAGGGGAGGNGGIGGIGGGGGDFGNSGGTASDGSGGNGSNQGLGGSAGGGFGGGGAGGPGGQGGFGGGGGAFANSPNGGVFGGSGGGSNVQSSGGGGAGLGGAIFARNGVLMLYFNYFFNNSASKGLRGQSDAFNGQGKGGALYISAGVEALHFDYQPTSLVGNGNTATDAGINTACSTVAGAAAVDTNDVCGIVLPGWVISASAGNPQSAPRFTGGIVTAFPYPLEVSVTDADGNALSGIPVSFRLPGFGPNASLSSSTAITDATGRARVTAFPNAIAGSYQIQAGVSNAFVPAEWTLANVNPSRASGPCIVTSTADDNSAGTLRYQAAACGKGGTITFSLPGGANTVTLSQGEDIQLTQDITIDGGGAVSVNANRQSRIFFITGGNITLKNLTLKNGLAQGGAGGIGLGSGGGAAGMGGAVFINGGNVTCQNTTFLNNQAQGGNGGPGENGASGGGGGAGTAGGFDGVGGGGGDFGSSGGTGGDGSGGNAYNAGGVLNGGFGGGGTAGYSGGFGGGGGVNGLGGIFGGHGNSSFDGSGGGGGGLGGAIFVRTGALILIGGTFTSNSAAYGTGPYGPFCPTGGINCISTNGQGKGGALFVFSGATVINNGATFSSNTATDAGSGTPCNSIVGALAVDTNDVCGVPALSFGHSRPITISHSQVPAGQNSFPVLIQGTFAYLANTANGGFVQNANGYDILFTSDSAGANLLNWEVESYSPVTGKATFWVKVPNLASATDTTIYLHYGNPGVQSFLGNAAGTWDSNFAAVYHMSDNAPTPAVFDSTSNANQGVLQANTNTKSAAGQMANALNFNGAGDYVNNGTAPAVDITGPFTLEGWVNLNAWPAPGYGGLLGSKGQQYFVEFTTGNSGDHGIVVGTYAGPNFAGTAVSMPTSFAGSFHHVAGSWDGVNWNLYVDGQAAAQTLSPQGPFHWPQPFLSGAQAFPGGVNQFLNASLDEVRLSNIARSPSWIQTEYNNQRNPSSFYSIGSDSATGTPITVSVSPAPPVNLIAGQPQHFTAAVTGNANTAVTWSISPVGVGSIDQNGNYTAPTPVSPLQTSVAVIATSKADSTTFGGSTATLVPVSVTINPVTGSLGPGQQVRLAAVVTGSSNTAVTWNANGNGSIDPTGVYTAPNPYSVPAATITAISQADTSMGASINLQLIPISVTVSPSQITLTPNAHKTFSAAVLGSTNQNVTWSIYPITGAGTVDQSGNYIAPPTISVTTATVTATSAADITKIGYATITLTPYAGTCPPPATNSWTACYYSDAAFGTLVLAGNSPYINFSGPGGIPAGVQSIRWQGNFVFQGAKYNFFVGTDYHALVYFDGTEVFDSWLNNVTQLSPNNYEFTLGVTGGSHLVEMDYIHGTGVPLVSLGWATQ